MKTPLVLVTELLLVLAVLQIIIPGIHSRQLTAKQKQQLMKEQTQYLNLPCSCSGDHCGCCAMLIVPLINFNQKCCLQLTYDPKDLAINLDILLNDFDLYHTSLSARNPPPICIGTGIPLLSVCARVYDIRVQGQNVHACANLELQFANHPLIVVSFDCVRIGSGGLILQIPPASLVNGRDRLFKGSITNLQGMLNSKIIKLPVSDNRPLSMFGSISSNTTNIEDFH